MKHRWAALGTVLALSALVSTSAAAQGADPPGRERQPEVALGQNYPNPFNPETRIPFTLGNAQCTDQGQLFRVSLTVYNVLAQPVAIPILMGEGTHVPEEVRGQSLRSLLLPCGPYTAYWDGKYMNTLQEVASGLYIYRLEVDGRVVTKKMIVTK